MLKKKKKFCYMLLQWTWKKCMHTNSCSWNVLRNEAITHSLLMTGTTALSHMPLFMKLMISIGTVWIQLTPNCGRLVCQTFPKTFWTDKCNIHFPFRLVLVTRNIMFLSYQLAMLVLCNPSRVGFSEHIFYKKYF